MKLKLISAMILGFVGVNAFAVGAPVSESVASDNPATVTKTKHHYHHAVAPEVANYKQEVPVEPAPVEVCTQSQSDFVLDMMTQNTSRSLPNPCNPGWFNRIQWSGGVNVDMGKWGNRNANLMGVNYQAISLNDAYLNISAIVNDWTKAFASISYNTTTINEPIFVDSLINHHVSEYANAYNGIPLSQSLFHGLQLEQGYFTVGNFEAYPIFLQVGKQFQDFSRYDIHPITRSLTQVMSETLAVSAKLGFISEMGFNGSIFAFDDPIHKAGQSHYPVDYGVALGFQQTVCDWGWDLGVAYLYDLMGVNDIAYNVAQFNFFAGNGIAYQARKAGIAAYGDVNYGPFTVGIRWTGAINRFNPFDLPRHGVVDTNQLTGEILPGTIGAKPWTAGIQAGYAFDGLWNLPQHVYVSYQTSRQAAALQLPHHRWLVGLGISPWVNTDFIAEWDHDISYNYVNGGSGNITNLATIRADVKFG